jgi:sugar phosphate isomerase/epimerase
MTDSNFFTRSGQRPAYINVEAYMAAISRREFLKQSATDVAVAGFLAVGARELRANPLGLPIGSQTYPHRQRIKDGDFAGLCKDMAALGVGSLELCSPGYEEFACLADARRTKQILDDHGLMCPSSHFTLEELRTRQQQMIAWAKDIGMTQMGTASLEGPVQNGVTTMDAVQKAVDEYNKIGEAAAEAGIQQFLHDERFEMSKVDGRLTYEVLLELLDPKLVKMQFQMSAMRVVGDPVMYFTKYPGRFISMHLQGVDLNAPLPGPGGGQGARPGRGGRRGGVAVGKDSLDWAKVFAAAKTGGVKNYFIEQNWDLTMQGVAYLKTLNV